MYLLFALLACAATPELHTETIYRGGDDGYHTYRIPALIAAQDGTLLAFAEARRDHGRDPGFGDIDLVVKRSEDGGKTWSDMEVVDDPGEGWSASNATPVLDRANGRIHLLFNRWEPGRSIHDCEPGTRHNQSWVMTSDDNGDTWSEPRDITADVRNIDRWAYTYFGPGGAIQMESGRLVVPGAARFMEGDEERFASYVVYSDDGGESWVAGTPSWHRQTNESQVVELFPGYLLMNARQETGDQSVFFTSSDDGLTWGIWVPGVVVTPIATGWENHTVPDTGKRAIVWTGPPGPGRLGMKLHVDADLDQYFEKVVPISDQPAAYSDLESLADGDLGVLWETGEDNPYQTIAFTRIEASAIFE